MRNFINQIEPWIDEEELIQLKRVIDSTFVTEGKLTEEFENMLCEYTDSKYAIAMCNGTVTLFSCLKALGIGRGDEVLVPDMTFIATANAVLMAGAKPVFCDIDRNSFCIDAEEIDKKITKRTKAIIPVHLYGKSADMEKIIDIAKTCKHSIPIIEDAAQGIGVRFMNKHVGTFGEMGSFSFYGNKTITCGEGGAILTNDKNLRDLCYKIKNHGRLEKGVFFHSDIGYNFSFTEMQAAVGIAQMKKLKRIIDKKKKINEKYKNSFKDFEDIFKPVPVDSRVVEVCWFSSYLTDYVEELNKFLYLNKIGTRRFFTPLHRQPCYNHNIIGMGKKYTNSDWVYEKGISLPSSYGLREDEQDYIIEKIREFFRK